MTFVKVIYGHEHCPRCNAIADLRALPVEDSNMVELRLICPKCRLSKFVKLTTQKALKLGREEKKLLTLLERSTSPRRKDAILKKLQQVRKDKLVAEVQP